MDNTVCWCLLKPAPYLACLVLEALLLILILILNTPDYESDGRRKANFNLKLNSRSVFPSTFPSWNKQKAYAETLPPSSEVIKGCMAPAHLL